MKHARSLQCLLRRPRQVHRLSWISAALVVALITGWSGCRPKPPAENAAPPPSVTVANPVRQVVTEWDEYTGYLDAVDFIEVRARVSGLINSMPFESGSIVSKGDLLVEIDARPFRADLESRIADAAKAEAEVRIAELELKRIEDLPQESSVPIERERADAALSAAKAVLDGAKAAVEAAQLLVEWCRVTAPITGRISNRYVGPGNLITGGSGTGTLLTTIASIDPIYCRIEADERAVLKYQRLARENKRVSARNQNIPFYMQLADETTFSHEGVIDFVDNRIDPMTGTMRARGVLENPDGWLTPGYFARIRIPGAEPYEATLVPDAAVLTDQNQKVLLVVNDEDKVEARIVKLGAVFGDLRAIESGVGQNDRVVIKGLMQVRPGAKVIPEAGSISLVSLEMPTHGSMAKQPPPPNEEPSAASGEGQP